MENHTRFFFFPFEEVIWQWQGWWSTHCPQTHPAVNKFYYQSKTSAANLSSGYLWDGPCYCLWFPHHQSPTPSSTITISWLWLPVCLCCHSLVYIVELCPSSFLYGVNCISTQTQGDRVSILQGCIVFKGLIYIFFGARLSCLLKF